MTTISKDNMVYIIFSYEGLGRVYASVFKFQSWCFEMVPMKLRLDVFQKLSLEIINMASAIG